MLSERSHTGFTVLELIVTIALTSILLALAVPNLNEWWGSMSRNTARHQLLSDIGRMRSEAVSRGTLGVSQLDPDSEGYVFGLDLLPYAAAPAVETQLFRSNLPANVTLSLSDPIIFDSRGFLVDQTGALNSINLALFFNGTAFATGTIFPTGYVELN